MTETSILRSALRLPWISSAQRYQLPQMNKNKPCITDLPRHKMNCTEKDRTRLDQSGYKGEALP